METHTDSHVMDSPAGHNPRHWFQRPAWVLVQRGEIKLPGSMGLPARNLQTADLSVLLALARGDQDDLLEKYRSLAHDSTLIGDLVLQGLVGAEQSTHWMLQSNLPDSPPPKDVTSGEGAPVITGILMVFVSPVLLKISSRGFEHLDHDGRVLITLDDREIQAAVVFHKPMKLARARDLQRKRLGEDALTNPEFNQLVERLLQSGLLRISDAENKDLLFKTGEDRNHERGWREYQLRSEATDKVLAEERRLESERVRAGARARVPVVPVSPQAFPLLSLGMVLTAARIHKGGFLENHFQILPDWANRTLSTLDADDPPGIFLYSNYIWTSRQNHEHSNKVKSISPHSLIIHGGPDVPKYPADVEAFFVANRAIDIAVIGEGEGTFPELLEALAGKMGDGPPDLSQLHNVPGIAFRLGNRVIRTGERERIADVNAIPSPFLTGLFDSCGDGGVSISVIETNRGCPYGCTFCDWGSATLSRIRKFDLDRVFAELEWCARHRAHGIYLADANFGIFPRDVEIAEKLVELKERYGYPRMVETNYAKNSVKYLGQIVRTLSSAGLLNTGLLSLQTMDKGTLDTIRRSNIKVAQYDNLAREFRKEGLPLGVDIMMGLPGSTRESFLEDLQQCVDREVRGRIFNTQLLVNSPMNDPAYRETHKIVTSNPVSAAWAELGKPAMIVSTASFSRADYDDMTRMRILFILLENFGILRLTSRFVHHACGVREVEFYVGLSDAARRSPERWPTIAFVLETLPDILLPPGSWRHFIDEVHGYLAEVLGIENDSALQTIMTVQHALLPARDRQFPQHLELKHDVTEWHRSRLAAKDDGHLTDWTDLVPQLREFGPGNFTITDPQQVCERGLGSSWSYDMDSDWELGSPIARPMSNRRSQF